MIQYPQCIHIDMELDNNKLLNNDEEENVKNYANMEADELNKFHDLWMLETVDKILGKDFEQKLKEQQEQEQNKINDNAYILDYDMDIDQEFVERESIFVEDIKFEVLNEIGREGNEQTNN